MEWIFDGIGSTIVGIVLSFLLGGVSGTVLGYKIGIKNRIEQEQKGGNNANQIEIGSVNNVNGNEATKR